MTLTCGFELSSTITHSGPYDRGHWHQTGNKTYFSKNKQLFYIERISTLTGLKVSSLPCKCVFNIPEHNAKGGPHGIEFGRS